MSDPRIVAVFGSTGAQYIPLLSELLPDWRVEGWTNAETAEARDALIARSEAAVISPDFVLTPGNFGALMLGQKLRIIVQPWVGTDWIDPDQLPDGLLVATASGHAAPIAEFILACMLLNETDLMGLDRDLRRGDWTRGGYNVRREGQHGDLSGKTLGLIGFGEIGQATATRAEVFGVRSIAVARSKREKTPAPLDWIGTKSDVTRLCEESDYIVCTCDLNDETRHILDAEQFAAMKPSAYVINVARGEVIAEKAFYEALKTGQIAGATIDTWYRYPADPMNPEPDPDRGGPFQGSSYDFMALPNVIVTPHASAHTYGADRGRYISIGHTLAAYAAGEPIARHVLTGTGKKLA